MDINKLFNNSELAQAAYADLSVGNTRLASNLATLTDPDDGAGMSQKQADKFAARYTEVITQFNDTETSFSATVFKDAGGNLTLAIRGTSEAGDYLPTDADIFLRGAGYDQIVAMFNWWQRAASSAGEMVQQFTLEGYQDGIDTVPAGAVFLYRTEGAGQVPIGKGYYLVSAANALATGELVGALIQDSDHRLDVTGHSLGGHLAMVFGSVFAAQTDQVTTFNAPGFKDSLINQNFFAALGGAA